MLPLLGVLALLTLVAIGGKSQGASGTSSVPPSFPLPRSYGVPFARGRGKVWPVVTGAPARLSVPYFPLSSPTTLIDPFGGAPVGARAFHASRESGKRWHAGVDLFASPGDAIVAMGDGVVVGPATGYVGLGALVVDHGSHVVLYGEMELAPGLKTGDVVKAGQRLGTARESLGTSPGAVRSTMLHLETWERDHAPKAFTPWYQGSSPPTGLLDPTLFLLSTAEAVRAG